MHAAAGDRIIVHSRHLGEPERDGKIVEVRGKNGEPPYMVEWSEDGHTGLYYPSSDAVVHHAEDAPQST